MIQKTKKLATENTEYTENVAGRIVFLFLTNSGLEPCFDQSFLVSFRIAAKCLLAAFLCVLCGKRSS